MKNLIDLNLKEEILPIFDYTINAFARSEVLRILEHPLSSVEQIIERQQILRGFSANQAVLNEYTYNVSYLREVYSFLQNVGNEHASRKRTKRQLLVHKSTKYRYIGKLSQLILVFYQLESRYFSKLNLDCFPTNYASTIERIKQFLSHFQLEKHKSIIQKGGLKRKHVAELLKTLNELQQQKEILTFWEDLFRFEAFLSISIAITQNQFCYPNFSQGSIALYNLYHPLLKDPIKNDFVTNSNVIVFNGPNMSGKSTFLKTIGLCIYLGHLGIGIPASNGEIPFCDYLSIDINRKDDLSKGYSHFMTEIVNLKSIAQRASKGKRCIAIFDELFRGTNVEDGFEICKTTINGLSKFNNSIFFISTHIQELKSVSNKKTANYYIDCELIEDKPVFTYQLKQGWSDIKIGRIIFEKEGLNDLLG